MALCPALGMAGLALLPVPALLAWLVACGADAGLAWLGVCA